MAEAGLFRGRETARRDFLIGSKRLRLFTIVPRRYSLPYFSDHIFLEIACEIRENRSGLRYSLELSITSRKSTGNQQWLFPLCPKACTSAKESLLPDLHPSFPYVRSSTEGNPCQPMPGIPAGLACAEPGIKLSEKEGPSMNSRPWLRHADPVLGASQKGARHGPGHQWCGGLPRKHHKELRKEEEEGKRG